MAVRGFFYNATDMNDRERRYNGQDMNEDKAPFYKEGVAFGHLQVTAEGGSMDIKVDGGERTGYAFINLHTVHNTSVLKLTLSQANGTLPRIDRVVLRNDETERRPSIYVSEGAYSRNPQPPQLINNKIIQEKSLASIYVKAGAVEITQANITDERPDETVCGFIGSQFKELDFSQLSAQFNAWFAEEKDGVEKDRAAFVRTMLEFEAESEQQFTDWFESIKDILEAAGNGALLEEIRELYVDLYKRATESDIDRIIDGTYTDEDESSSVFETATNDDIDAIINETYIESTEEPDTVTDESITAIVDKAFSGKE